MKNNLSNNIIGGLWILLSAFSFSLSNLFVKKIGSNIPAFEIATLRCLMQILFLIPFICQKGLFFLATAKIKFYFFRLFFGITNMVVFYYVITKIPMATAVAISYARPIFMVVLAFFMLGEKVGLHRIISTIVGFMGVIILIRPTPENFNYASLLAVFAALCYTLTHIYIKRLSITEHPMAMLMWFAIAASVVCLPFTLAVWVTPNLQELSFIIILSLFSFIAQYATIKAFFYGEASIVSSLDYSQIVFASILGMIFLNEIPDFYTYIGAGIIVMSSIYILYREKRAEN